MSSCGQLLSVSVTRLRQWAEDEVLYSTVIVRFFECCLTVCCSDC